MIGCAVVFVEADTGAVGNAEAAVDSASSEALNFILSKEWRM